jgi:hypothetical protein
MKENLINDCDFLNSQFLLAAAIMITRTGRHKKSTYATFWQKNNVQLGYRSDKTHCC